MTLKEIQNRNWHHLIESLFENVESRDPNFCLKTKSKIKNDKRYGEKLQGAMDGALLNIVKHCRNFQAYLFSPDFSEQEEIENDIGTNSSRIFHISENLGANSPLNSFDLFYYINGRFPFTAGHLYVPDGVKPDVNVKKLKIKEIYKTFRVSNSPSKWPSLPAISMRP